jgi:hypothetical protein
VHLNPVAARLHSIDQRPLLTGSGAWRLTIMSNIDVPAHYQPPYFEYSSRIPRRKESHDYAQDGLED